MLEVKSVSAKGSELTLEVGTSQMAESLSKLGEYLGKISNAGVQASNAGKYMAEAMNKVGYTSQPVMDKKDKPHFTLGDVGWAEGGKIKAGKTITLGDMSLEPDIKVQDPYADITQKKGNVFFNACTGKIELVQEPQKYIFPHVMKAEKIDGTIVTKNGGLFEGKGKLTFTDDKGVVCHFPKMSISPADKEVIKDGGWDESSAAAWGDMFTHDYALPIDGVFNDDWLQHVSVRGHGGKVYLHIDKPIALRNLYMVIKHIVASDPSLAKWPPLLKPITLHLYELGRHVVIDGASFENLRHGGLYYKNQGYMSLVGVGTQTKVLYHGINTVWVSGKLFNIKKQPQLFTADSLGKYPYDWKKALGFELDEYPAAVYNIPLP